MAPASKSNRTYRRGPSVVDCALALSVMAGLGFVTVRMMSMAPMPTATLAVETDLASAKAGAPNTAAVAAN